MNSTTIALNIADSGLAFSKITASAADTAPIPFTNRTDSTRSALKNYSPHPSDNFSEKLCALEYFINHSSKAHAVHIVFGTEVDPFHPFDEIFEHSLKAIAVLGRSSAASIVIQTCSPLVLLAHPVIKSLGERLTIRIIIDAIDDETNRTLGLNRPRPSERLRTASTLQELRINTEIVMLPLSQAKAAAKDMHKSLETIWQTIDAVRVLAAPALWEDSLSLAPDVKCIAKDAQQVFSKLRDKAETINAIAA